MLAVALVSLGYYKCYQSQATNDVLAMMQALQKW